MIYGETAEPWNIHHSLNTDVWSMEQNEVARLFERKFAANNKLIFDTRVGGKEAKAGLKFQNSLAINSYEASQSVSLLDSTELNLKCSEKSIRLRLKPNKVLAHLDFGPSSLRRLDEPGSAYFVRPYAFFASDRQLARQLWSFGHFLYDQKGFEAHTRLTMLQKKEQKDLYFQGNFVKRFKNITLNHLLVLRMFSPEAYIGNTFSLLAKEGPWNFRLEYSRERHDKNDLVSDGFKAGATLNAADGMKLGLDNHFDNKEQAWVSEFGVSQRVSESLKFKAKIDTQGKINLFSKMRACPKASVYLSLLSKVGSDLGDEKLMGLPFGLGIRVKFNL